MIFNNGAKTTQPTLNSQYMLTFLLIFLKFSYLIFLLFCIMNVSVNLLCQRVYILSHYLSKMTANYLLPAMPKTTFSPHL